MVLSTHLASSSINVFAFLFVKANSKEIYEEIYFPSFFRKKADLSFFFIEIQGELFRKHPWLPQFFFLNSHSPCKGLLFPRGPNLAQKYCLSAPPAFRDLFGDGKML